MFEGCCLSCLGMFLPVFRILCLAGLSLGLVLAMVILFSKMILFQLKSG